MPTIAASLELRDNFSNMLSDVVSSVNLAISSMYDMQKAVATNMDTSSLEGARESINKVTMALNEMNVAVEKSKIEPIKQSIEPAVQWQTDNMNIFMNSGVERFKQEVQSTNSLLSKLSRKQNEIALQASKTKIFPNEMFRDLNSMAVRVDNLKKKIVEIENSKVNIGTDVANRGLEQMRHQLSQAVQQQEELNEAMQSADISAANAAYMQLSHTVCQTEQFIRDNTNEQGRFNQEIMAGTKGANGLLHSVKGIAAAYISLRAIAQGTKFALNVSDEFTQTTARINAMREALGETEISTKSLMNEIYRSAQDARSSFADMASIVARIGNNAKDAFGSSKEVIKFANLVQKQMTISGASTEEASNATLQLSQALASGVLQGDELRSIFEQAPGLIQHIADYMDVPIGQIREMASEGEITADIVKQAMFAASDEINERFAEMPMTWEQMWTSFKNDALMSFQPVLDKLNEMANSERFQNFVSSARQDMLLLSDVVVSVLTAMSNAADFISSHWSAISPVIYGVIAALIVYKTCTLVCAAATAIMASPMLLIVGIIAALVAGFILLCRHIAETGGTAATTFGVMAGCINVVKEYFKNFGLEVANIAIGIWNAMKACAANMEIAFRNSIRSIGSWFFLLAADALTVISDICESLNKLPFIDPFDFSGITAKAQEYAGKSLALYNSKEDYKNVLDEFNKGMSTYDASLIFTKEQAAKAYQEGAEWGDGITDDFKRKLKDFKRDAYEFNRIPNYSTVDIGAVSNLGDIGHATDNLGNIADNTGNTAEDTARIADAVEITDEDLKYLRDIAEREIIDRTVFTKVEVNMGGISNEVHNMTDLDAIPDYINSVLQEKIAISAEG